MTTQFPNLTVPLPPCMLFLHNRFSYSGRAKWFVLSSWTIRIDPYFQLKGLYHLQHLIHKQPHRFSHHQYHKALACPQAITTGYTWGSLCSKQPRLVMPTLWLEIYCKTCAKRSRSGGRLTRMRTSHGSVQARIRRDERASGVSD